MVSGRERERERGDENNGAEERKRNSGELCV